MLPLTLDLSPAVLRRGQRILMDRCQAIDEHNWYAMAFRYQTSCTQEWRAVGKQDLDISMARLLHMLCRTPVISFLADMENVRYIASAKTLSRLYICPTRNLEEPLTNSTYGDDGRIALEAL